MKPDMDNRNTGPEEKDTGNEPSDLTPKEAAFGHVGRRRQTTNPEQPTDGAKSKIEKAEQLLREAHEELNYPDNSLIGPAISQLETHRKKYHE